MLTIVVTSLRAAVISVVAVFMSAWALFRAAVFAFNVLVAPWSGCNPETREIAALACVPASAIFAVMSAIAEDADDTFVPFDWAVAMYPWSFVDKALKSLIRSRARSAAAIIEDCGKTSAYTRYDSVID